MKYLIIEALNDYQKKYVDEKLGGDEYNSSEAHKEMFDSYLDKKHPDRIFFDANDIEYQPPSSLLLHLRKHGYNIHDFNKGLCKKSFIDKNGNGKDMIISIGKVLDRTNASHEIKKDYANSRLAVNGNCQLVISRDKYDIAGMSTNRKWESCMTLPNDSFGKKGSKNKHIVYDLDNHTLVAYLIKKGDNEIENPLGRVLIKKYTSSNGHSIYRANDGYGNISNSHIKKVNDIAKFHYPAIKDGKYHILKMNYDVNELPPENGIHTDGDVSRHYKDGKLNDYIDEKGNYIPAIKGTNTEYYYSNGLLHREGNRPAYTIKDDNGESIQYSLYGYGHNEINKPSYISKDAEGNVRSESYEHYGLFHRDGNLPSQWYKDENGIVRNEAYHVNGLLHRDEDLPSVIKRDKNGNVTNEQYTVNGEFKREDNRNPVKIDRVYKNSLPYYIEETYKNHPYNLLNVTHDVDKNLKISNYMPINDNDVIEKHEDMNGNLLHYNMYNGDRWDNNTKTHSKKINGLFENISEKDNMFKIGQFTLDHNGNVYDYKNRIINDSYAKNYIRNFKIDDNQTYHNEHNDFINKFKEYRNNIK